MSKKAKIIPLSTAALLAMSTAAFAAVDGYVTQKDGKTFYYSLNDLVASSTANQADPTSNAAKLWQHFADSADNGNIVSLHDDVKGYVSFQDVFQKYNQGLSEGKPLDVDAYTSTDAAKATGLPQTVTKITPAGENGQVGEQEIPTSEQQGELVVSSVTAITTSDDKVTVSGKATGAEKVKVTIDTAVAVEVTPAADGTFTYTTTSALAVGDHTVSVVAVKGDQTSEAKTTTVKVEALKVDSVTATNNKTIEVKLNKAIKKAGAEATPLSGTYSVTKIAGNSPLTVNSAVVSADGKTIVLTVAEEMINSANGYALTIAKDKIETLGGQKLAATEVIFDGNGTADNVKPSVVRADYDAANNKLTLKFNKLISSADSDVNEAKVTLVGAGTDQSTTLAETAYSGTAGSTDTVIFTVPAAVANYTQPIKVKVGAEFVQDQSATPLVNDAQEVEANIATKPAAQSARYDEQSNKLTITFNKTVDVKKIDLTKVKVKVNGGAAVAVGGKVLTTTNSNVVEIETGAAFELPTVTTAALVLDADAVKDADLVGNEAQASVSMTYTDDVTKPTLVSSSYNDLTDELTLVFSEKVKVDNTNTDLNKAGITVGGVAVTAVKSPANSETVVLTPGSTKPSATNKIAIAAGAVKDESGNDIDAVKDIVADVTDQTKPTFAVFDNDGDKETATSSTQVKVVFSEKVKKDQAENIANYKIYPTTNDAVTLAVTKATLDTDGKTVYLTTAPQAGIEYTVEVSNVQDLAGNVVTKDAQAADMTFDGTVGSSDTTGPKTANGSNEVVVIDKDEDGAISKGDQLKLVFTEALSVDFTQISAADFYVTDSSNVAKDSAAAFGTGAKFEVGDNSSEILITLGTLGAGKIALGDKIDVATDNDIFDLAGNKADQESAGNREVVTKSDVQPTITSLVYKDDNNNGSIDTGDTLTIQFSQKVDIDTGATLGDILETGAASSLGLSDSAEVVDTPLNDVTEAVVNIDNASDNDYTSLLDTDVKGLDEAPKVTNGWGNPLNALTTGIKITANDTDAPILSTVTVNDNGGDADVLETGDEVVLTFSEAVNLTDAAANKGKIYFVTEGGLQFALDGASGLTQDGTNNEQIVITIDGSSPWVGQSIQGAKLLTSTNIFHDASGNKAKTTTATNFTK